MSNPVKNGTILIIDDKPVNVKYLEKLLEMNGFTNIHSEQDSRNALHRIKDLKPNVLLLDLNMPHVSGFDILQDLQKESFFNKISVLVLTANQDERYRHRALDLGALDYLEKPLDNQEVVLRITNMISANLYSRFLEDQKSVLEDMVSAQTREILETQLAIIHRLGKAAEYKDNETGMHILRMSKVSWIVAKELGLSPDHCELLLHASPMHDIGKIGIPDQILLKPGRLDEEERKIMNTHTTIGGEIIGKSEIQLLQMAKVIAETHHEKWDGTGYPLGLKETEIPIEGRIVAIADVFDALVSERPYKKAWPVEDALQLIKENRGKHFDPAVVDAFLNRLDEILRIRSENPDHA